MLLFDESKWAEQEGIEAVVIDTGEYKSTGAPFAPITDNQRADLQRGVDNYFEQFRAAVTSGRGFDAEQWQAVSDGRTFIAQEALGLGLIDAVQSIEHTLQGLRPAKRAGRSTQAARRRVAARTT
jgi:ClpP class serine protease